MVNVKEVGEIYKCEICGNVVEVLEAGGGELICCGEPMILQE
ncbi:MAG TPA: desulfoferrodoxin FeS4 iron-binding domain-containing protein [Methanofastidiosum sp.]|jgi:desulfoferrodoxin-like iron-binding protein|nr:desulfoferrodoxin FeS4 iron-binding domain-containing protein [Methanofastidiosum sp.]HII95813.1 desulfoferrodoxin FeS4 iron-binding domain-containing protein [Methanofastidiosum sp.]HNR44420.1 desulfoferrodoxin FeS4 iron-binding domain-containing protein [Methanofastidiosum sp.]HNU61607.1 desulfoferrodoxin FeS4 iron-binding domain-containing protein [Methanofastidiosum sp.]HOI77111.1 desulfoferrodoxin FeS4 iron-binding domain-containing protein [Methanofastidiosum sp.]